MKKILLFIGMFLFIFNVKALTFDVNLTNIEDKGNNGTIGSITNIDLENKAIDAYFQDIGDEVNFALTITNSGDRAGTLRSIGITSSNDKIEYTHSLPEGGLAINGNDTNMVTIKAKVLPGAVNGTSSSEIKITYNYDEGSCPEGEILSDDESMCLCPEGMERNETGICVTPEKPVECKDDEIYNETKKICEKKVVPVNPSNPKTMDNIILITLLFVVSGLGIYAVMFKKLKTNKKKAVAGVITGVTTLALSFTVLASVFGLDNLLSAIVNPITKSKELVVTVNETLDLIETWDGTCSLSTIELTPDKIFEGGSGREADPYRIKTANQLACFAKSVNNGTTYQGQYIKQIKNIKLNDNLNEQAEAGDLSNANLWLSAGEKQGWSNNSSIHFDGTYDGDNHIISGLYLTDESTSSTDQYYDFKGLFGLTKNATFKNMILSDVYFNTTGNTGPLIGYALENLTLNNITTYGNGIFDFDSQYGVAGVVSNYDGNSVGNLVIENTTNNVNMTCGGQCSGVLARIGSANADTTNPNLIFKNVTNNGNIRFTRGNLGSSGIAGYLYASTGNLLADNCVNTGDFTFDEGISGDSVTGLFGYVRLYDGKFVVTNSHNEGDITGFNYLQAVAGIGGDTESKYTYIDNCYNSGDFIANVVSRNVHSYAGGILGSACDDEEDLFIIKNSYNTGDIYSPNGQFIAGMVGKYEDYSFSNKRIIENCYNTGDFTGEYGNGGIAGQYGGIIRECYNTGNIYSKTNNAGGILGYGGDSKISNSYNTGTITIDTGGSYIGGIAASGSSAEINNCYNQGDLIVLTYCSNVGGIQGQYGTITNSYNSGNIYLKTRSSMMASGIGYNGTHTNVYNLGDIIAEDGTAGYLAGISTGGSDTNAVNVGNIIVNVKTPYESANTFRIGGIQAYSSTATNCFNAGIITISDDILNDGLAHTFNIGEIGSDSGSFSGNKWNHTSSYPALGCGNTTCTAQSEAAGSYTEEATPDILSIINGDDAFEIKEGDTLPTLKVFN